MHYADFAQTAGRWGSFKKRTRTQEFPASPLEPRIQPRISPFGMKKTFGLKSTPVKKWPPGKRSGPLAHWPCSHLGSGPPCEAPSVFFGGCQGGGFGRNEVRAEGCSAGGLWDPQPFFLGS